VPSIKALIAEEDCDGVFAETNDIYLPNEFYIFCVQMAPLVMMIRRWPLTVFHPRFLLTLYAFTALLIVVTYFIALLGIVTVAGNITGPNAAKIEKELRMC
jgi:hypothetical protein